MIIKAKQKLKALLMSEVSPSSLTLFTCYCVHCLCAVLWPALCFPQDVMTNQQVVEWCQLALKEDEQEQSVSASTNPNPN